MRIVNLVRSGLAVVCFGASLAVMTTPSSAQSFFEQLFGFGQPAPRPQPRAFETQRPRSEPSTTGTRSDQRDDNGGGATYRTVCVRSCDGFFFPVSFATTKRNFAADEQKCQASCQDAKLYVYRNPGGGIEDATDIAGRAYTSQPTAFLFRKTRVEQCGCRPAPWSEAELKRHQSYAATIEPNRAIGQSANTLAAAAVATAPNTPATSGPDVATKDGNGTDAVAATGQATVVAPGSKTTTAEPDVKIAAAEATPQISKARSTGRSRDANQRRVNSAGVSASATYSQTAKSGSTKSGGGGFFSMGLGGPSKYVWPGDPPRN